MHQEDLPQCPCLKRNDVLMLIEENGGLTRNFVLTLIEKNGGSEGLDLSGCDLSGINLSRLDLRGIIFGSTETLKYAETEDVLTRGANLDGAWFERSNLQKANFGRVSMKGARFYRADLTESSLWNTKAEGADFGKVNFSRADLLGAVFKDCNLTGSILEGANLESVNLSGVSLSAESIGTEILQENLAEYRDYYSRWYIDPKVRESFEKESLNSRYKSAIEIYLQLKNAFMNSGRYGDASWAYIKERQIERKTYFPLTARKYYGHKLLNKHSAKSFQWWHFYIKYTFKWCLSWVADLLVGYGEKPFRAALASCVSIVFFAFLFWLSGGISNLSGQPLRLIDYLHYSIAAFSTIGFPDLVATSDAAKIFTSLEALTGISLLALFMFSLGNRINRS